MTSKRKSRMGEEQLNNQGCLMRIIQYNNSSDIIVEFQDDYKAKVHAKYQMFLLGKIKNPFYPSIFGVGIIGNQYPVSNNGKSVREYEVWQGVLRRCFDESVYEYKKFRTYVDVACCKEWLYYPNFYEWLHNQPNFDKWSNGIGWTIDKDILFKGNKVYSPETCCLVPQNVNKLFNKCDIVRGNLPIGVVKSGNKFKSYCKNPFTNKQVYLGTYSTSTKAFIAYKKYKENLIKQVAQIEYNKGNITKECYEAMVNYEVEITD